MLDLNYPWNIFKSLQPGELAIISKEFHIKVC